MKTLNLLSRLAVAALLVVSSTSMLEANKPPKKEKKEFSLTLVFKYGTSATVFSKYKFKYEPIPGFKLPTAGSNQKYQRNPMNLTMNKEGTIVTDHNTKLQWAARTLLVWTNSLKATEHCANMRYGGYDDWRLPTLKELTSVADYSTSMPPFSRKLFPGVPVVPSGYWAIPMGTGHSLSAWHVGFDGHIMQQSLDATKMTRCVRADNQLSYDKNLFTDNKDGTVADDVTALVWQQTDNGELYQFKKAVSYCENLEFAGRDDWRLPDFKELVSAMDYHKFRPAMDEAFFKEVKLEFYWTSTLEASKQLGKKKMPRAWAVETLSGGAWRYPVTNEYPVRCVANKK